MAEGPGPGRVPRRSGLSVDLASLWCRRVTAGGLVRRWRKINRLRSFMICMCTDPRPVDGISVEADAWETYDR